MSVKADIERLSGIRRALVLVWNSARGWTIGNAAILLVQGVLPLAQLYLMKLIVDAVTSAVAGGADGDWSTAALYVILAGTFSLIGVLCSSLGQVVTEAQSQTVVDHVLDLLHAKSVEADLEYYESPRYYDSLHLAQQQAPYRPVLILNGLVQLGRSGLSLAAVAGLLLAFYWPLALLMFAAAIPGAFVRFRYASKMYEWQRKNTPAERQAEYFHWMLTNDTHAKETRLFNLGRIFMDRFNELRRRLRGERIALVRARSIREFLSQACALIAVFAALLFIVRDTIAGQLGLGDMVMLFAGFQRGQTFLRDMLSGLAAVYENSLFISNFHRFLDLEKKVKDPPHPKPVPAPIRQGIRFEDVVFSYHDSARDVLAGMSLEIRPGEHVALVGENGAGKSTLVKLLCRLYDPLQGRITVDGTDLRDLGTVPWRREISVIFQDFARYQLTARENIRLGNVELDAASESVLEAARFSGADGVVQSLPKGMDTLLGKWFEDGEELSIGQWQKVALARAFLRPAQLLVLDEPTSALDAGAEADVLKQFHQLARGRTALIISHRMSTVRLAHRILVLGNGVVLESGTHEELLQRGGPYARLYRLQTQGYQ